MPETKPCKEKIQLNRGSTTNKREPQMIPNEFQAWVETTIKGRILGTLTTDML